MNDDFTERFYIYRGGSMTDRLIDYKDYEDGSLDFMKHGEILDSYCDVLMALIDAINHLHEEIQELKNK
jgi:hypothetical protein